MALRGDAPMSRDVEDLVDRIDRALARSPLPADALLLRRVGPAALGVDRPDDVVQAVGSIRTVPGYLATTVAERAPRLRGAPILMEVTVPAGTPAAYLASVSRVPLQRELLLARGLEFVVTAGGYDRRRQRWVVAVTIG